MFSYCLGLAVKYVIHNNICIPFFPNMIYNYILAGKTLFILLCLYCTAVSLGFQPDSGIFILFAWNKFWMKIRVTYEELKVKANNNSKSELCVCSLLVNYNILSFI